MTKKAHWEGEDHRRRCSIDFFIEKESCLQDLEQKLESNLLCTLFCWTPLYDKKTKSVLRENTSCKRLKSKGKILFWILVRHSSLWSEAVDFQWIFFKGSTLKIACQEKAIFNAFLQRKPPLNVKRIDASFLLTKFFFF